ncbi:unnamed protein product [Hymenolepis diminuta]|uniref:Uncharacterized protein n=1 Tax=Hymenolepis diminuta TaxID=6216 RepID=A0A564Z1S7_HYMDI|nr:unnamed protein product [Hymenolepis diminuta]
MRRYCRIDHHKPKENLPTGKHFCPVNGCYKKHVKRGWLRNQMKTCNSNFHYGDDEKIISLKNFDLKILELR